jgi:hypothetical protein
MKACRPPEQEPKTPTLPLWSGRARNTALGRGPRQLSPLNVFADSLPTADDLKHPDRDFDGAKALRIALEAAADEMGVV